MKVIHNLN